MRRVYKLFVAAVVLAMLLGATATVFASGEQEAMTEEQYREVAEEVAATIDPDRSVLSEEEMIEELMWFAQAAEPYRGQTIRASYESVPLTDWEAENLAPLFEQLTGINVQIEGVAGDETMRSMRMEAETKQGAYDTISIDQDMVGFFTYNGGVLDLTEFMEENPEITSPTLDLEDYSSNMICRNALNGNLLILADYQKPVGTVYRKDWFTDPENKAAFEEEYGYELKTPMQWYLEAKESGNVEDDWTFEKSLDVAEFFTRPEENMWGTIIGQKNAWHLAWYFNDVMDQAAGLGSKTKGPPLTTEPPAARPYSWVYGVKYAEDGETILGSHTSRGGRLNGPRGVEALKYVHFDLAQYSPSKIKEIGAVEAYVQFGVEGNYAFNHQHLIFYPTYNGPDSAIKGKYEVSPVPVSEKYFEYGMVRGYWDAEGWVITEGSKHPEATWLFAQFMTSKSVSVWKNLNGIMPIRYSTINSPQFEAMDEELGGHVSLLQNEDFIEVQAGTDELWPGFPDTNEPVSTAIAEALGQDMSPQEMADLVAERLDQFLIDKGYIEE